MSKKDLRKKNIQDSSLDHGASAMSLVVRSQSSREAKVCSFHENWKERSLMKFSVCVSWAGSDDNLMVRHHTLNFTVRD